MQSQSESAGQAGMTAEAAATRSQATGFSSDAAPEVGVSPTRQSPLTGHSEETLVEQKPSKWRRIISLITWTPKRCRYDPNSPPRFSMALNFLFGFAACFTVANLYYNHPILNQLAIDFNVSYLEVSIIPTLFQAGYASGLLFLCPLGDLFKRRPFVLSLIFATATIWIGLCVTTSFKVFAALSFLTAVTTVTPQLMLPLVGGLAPANRRATSLSIVTSGLIFGILIARVLSGVITEYSSWRSVYWLALGLQYFIFVLLWFFMPDYPSANPEGLNYFKMLWSIITIAVHEPIVLQACAIGLFTCSVFTSYWTTLTFLLASPPYEYSNLAIGLFALVGMGSMCIGPFYSRYVIDKLIPLFSVIVGELICLTGVVVGTYTGTFTVAGPIIQAFAIDLGMQISQISNRSAIFVIRPMARNRINTAYMVSVFCGQLMGTAVGNQLYSEGGWVKSGSASVGFIGAALLLCFVRGPWEKGYVGWRGGWSLRRRDLGPKNPDVEKQEDGRADGQAPETAVEVEYTPRISSDGRHASVGGMEGERPKDLKKSEAG